MVNNLFASLPASLPSEIVEPLHRQDNVRIERIVSHGHASPAGFWYDQTEDEWVLVAQGAARLKLMDSQGEERDVELAAGDYCFLPAHQRHRVEWTTPEMPTIWLAIFIHAGGSASSTTMRP